MICPVVGQGAPPITDQQTPLGLAAKLGKQKASQWLLQAGASPNTKDNEGRVPLTFAIARGDATMTKLLLEHGANPDIQDNHGLTPAMQSVMFPSGSVACLKLCLEHGANPNLQHVVFGGLLQTALRSFRQEIDAANGKTTPELFKHRLEAIKLLLSHGADVNGFGFQGFTPLIFAAAYGQDKLFELFLERGANVNAMDDSGGTPLIRAILPTFANKPNMQMIDSLLAHHADPNVGIINPLVNGGPPSPIKAVMIAKRDGNAAPSGSTRETRELAAKLLKAGAIFPLKATYTDAQDLLRASTTGNVQEVKTLLVKGVHPDLSDNLGWSPIMSASALGYSDIIRTLVDAGVSANAEDETSISPLWLSISNVGSKSDVDLLLSKGAPPNDSTDFLGPIILAAVIRGDETIVKELLDKGASPNLVLDTDLKYPAPLLRAVLDQRTPIVKLLLDYGADPSPLDKDGHTPLYFAIIQNNPEIVSLLISADAATNLTPTDKQSLLNLAHSPKTKPEIKKLIEDSTKSPSPTDSHSPG